MKKVNIILILLITSFGSFAQNQAIPYTLADRDRLIKLEESVNSLRNEMNSLRNEMNSLRNEMNARFEGVDAKFVAVDAKFEMVNSKIDYIFWLLGVIVALMIFMLGFIIWDRRTFLNPVKAEIDSLKQDNEKIKIVLRQQTEFLPQLREILKNAGIL